ncbi:glutaredoxin [Diplocarpon rosae]|nr:glutaredoxin [Diplocarpon rosae]
MSYHHKRPSQNTPIFSRRESNAPMPSVRRVKVLGLVIVMIVVTMLFYTSSKRQQGEIDGEHAGDFYSKTKSALERMPVGGGASTAGKGKSAGTGSKENEDIAKAMAEQLKLAAQVAKDNANAKAPKPDPPSKVVGVGNAAEGANKKSVDKKKNGPGEAQVPMKEEKSKDDENVKAELNSILKKSTIIIFSKSYCPHSARAKGILLEKYIIDPKPYVVELDKHKLGLELQARLADLTGRKTVPNVLINGVTIGGGDEVAALDSSRTLIEKITTLGGKKIAEAKLRPLEDTKEKPAEAAKDGVRGLR